MYPAIHFGIHSQWSINIDQIIQLFRTESHFIKTKLECQCGHVFDFCMEAV